MAKKKKKKTENKKGKKKEKKTVTKVVEPEEEIWYRRQLKIKSEQLMKEGLEDVGWIVRAVRSAPMLRTWGPGPETGPRMPPFFPAVTPPNSPKVAVWELVNAEDTPLAIHMTKEEATSLMEHRLPDWFSGQNIHLSKWLLYEVLRWAIARQYNNAKVSSLLAIFYNTHAYFCQSMWRNQEDVYYFFKKSILLHTILDPPKSATIFSPDNCRDGLLLFCRIYLPHLPLLRLLLMPTYRLELQWQALPPKSAVSKKEKKKKEKKK